MLSLFLLSSVPLFAVSFSRCRASPKKAAPTPLYQYARISRTAYKFKTYPPSRVPLLRVCRSSPILIALKVGRADVLLPCRGFREITQETKQACYTVRRGPGREYASTLYFNAVVSLAGVHTSLSFESCVLFRCREFLWRRNLLVLHHCR